MFDDCRSKKVFFLAHCILNQNAISDGTAERPGTLENIVTMLVRNGMGMVQLPCPEFICLGLDRGNICGGESAVLKENTRIRKMMMVEPAVSRIKQLVQQVVFQIREYRRFHFDVPGIVGINRSPSCGVDTTSKDDGEVDGKGVFMERLRCELQNIDINLPFIGIQPTDTEGAVFSIQKLIDRSDH